MDSRQMDLIPRFNTWRGHQYILAGREESWDEATLTAQMIRGIADVGVRVTKGDIGDAKYYIWVNKGQVDKVVNKGEDIKAVG